MFTLKCPPGQPKGSREQAGGIYNSRVRAKARIGETNLGSKV